MRFELMDVVITRAFVLLLVVWWPLGITATVWKDTTWRLPKKIAMSTGSTPLACPSVRE